MVGERIMVYVPGILTVPGESRNWSGRAVTFTHIRTDYRAEKVEYFCGPIGRAFGQQARAHKLYRTLTQYGGYGQRVLVGHSNGSDVIVTMFRNYPAFPRVDALHLVCGATAASFNANGLNRLLACNRVGRVVVYVAGQDRAMLLANLRPARWLGYGTLGLHGPRYVHQSVAHRVEVVKASPWDAYGHSSCWADSEFAATMAHFLKP